MPQEFHYRLHSVSVVVTAEYHNPSILNPDFLKFQRIVPREWESKLTITTPQFSTIQFENGISWSVDQSTLTVLEPCESEFRNEYFAHEIVASYLDKLSHVPYRNLGLNCVVAQLNADPERWLTERYLKEGRWLQTEPLVRAMIPRFTLDAGEGALCYLSLGTGTFDEDTSNPQGAVIANCNVHHEGPLDLNSLQDGISRWPQRQEFVKAALSQLLEST
jgi:hypothetical protein